MLLCYIPAQTIFTLYKILGFSTEQVPPLVRDYFFQLTHNWFSNDSYQRMKHITLNSNDETSPIQELLTLTQEQPDMLMLVLVRSLLLEDIKRWPFAAPKDPSRPETIDITRVQFQVEKNDFTIAFQCVLNNQHNTAKVSLKDWRNHLLQILEYKRWLGVCETAQLSDFTEVANFQNARFHVDSVALAWDQWHFLMEQSIQPSPFQESPVNPQLNICTYRENRAQTITNVCVTQFNDSLCQAWKTYQDQEQRFSWDVKHLKNDIATDAERLEHANKTINSLNEGITLTEKQINQLETDMANLETNLLEKISHLKPIYVAENTKSRYFLNIRYLDNQAKRKARNEKALLALGLRELPPVKAISSEDRFTATTDTYHCSDEENAYGECQRTFEQLKAASVHKNKETLDTFLHQDPLRHPLAEYDAEPSRLQAVINPLSDKESSKPVSISGYYEKLKNRYAALEAQWQASNLCFEAHQRCLTEKEQSPETKTGQDINKCLLFSKETIQPLSQEALATKKALLKAFSAYDTFNKIWKEKKTSIAESINTLYSLFYSVDTDKQAAPKGLNTLTQGCNTLLNQPRQWAMDNNRHGKVVAQYDLANSETINSITTSSHINELFNIQTLLASVINALEEPSFLYLLKKGVQQLPNIHVAKKEALMPTIKEAFLEAPWHKKLNAVFTTFKTSHYDAYRENFTLSDNTSALLEIYFENESTKLLAELNKKSNNPAANLVAFWQLVMISAIIPNNLEQLLITTPHHRAYVFRKLVEKIREQHKIDIPAKSLSPYIYFPQETNFFEVKTLSIKELPEPFNEKDCSIPLNEQQKNRLQSIRLSTTPKTLEDSLHMAPLGDSIFPQNNQIKDYLYTHECFKGPQLMLALYYIELKIKEATAAYEAFHNNTQWICPLAKDFIALIHDVLHYPQWQAILKDDSEIITLTNPQAISDTQELTALAFIQKSTDLFPSVNAAINAIPSLQIQQVERPPSHPSSPSGIYHNGPFFNGDYNTGDSGINSHDPASSHHNAFF